MSPHLQGGGHIVFGADPVGMGLGSIGVGAGICGVGVTFVCTKSYEPVVGSLPNFHGYIIRT